MCPVGANHEVELYFDFCPPFVSRPLCWILSDIGRQNPLPFEPCKVFSEIGSGKLVIKKELDVWRFF